MLAKTKRNAFQNTGARETPRLAPPHSIRAGRTRESRQGSSGSKVAATISLIKALFMYGALRRYVADNITHYADATRYLATFATFG